MSVFVALMRIALTCTTDNDPMEILRNVMVEGACAERIIDVMKTD